MSTPNKKAAEHYLELAKQLLEVEELHPAPMPQTDWNAFYATGEAKTHPSHKNPGDLSDADEQKLAALIYSTLTLPPDLNWKGLSEGQRIPWLETALDKIAPAPMPEQAEAPANAHNEQACKRIQIDLAKQTVTLDGETSDVPSRQALRWLQVLINNPADWISGKDLGKYDSELVGVRTDRLKIHLPEKVQALIDSATGSGSRIRL